MQFVEKLPWIPSFGINYYVGIDGVSLFLILLTTFITPLSILASWHITKSIKEYMIAMLVLETGMIGVFISLGFIFVLRILGTHADSDVPSHRHLGRPQEDLRSR